MRCHLYMQTKAFLWQQASTCLEYEGNIVLHTCPVHYSTFQTILTILTRTYKVTYVSHWTDKNAAHTSTNNTWWGGGSCVRVLNTENLRAISPLPPIPFPSTLSDYCIYVPNMRTGFVCLEPLSITFPSHLSNLTWYRFVWGNWKGKHCKMEVIVMTIRYKWSLAEGEICDHVFLFGGSLQKRVRQPITLQSFSQNTAWKWNKLNRRARVPSTEKS